MRRAAHGCRRPEISSHEAFQSGSSSAAVTLLPSRKVTMEQPATHRTAQMSDTHHLQVPGKKGEKPINKEHVAAHTRAAGAVAIVLGDGGQFLSCPCARSGGHHSQHTIPLPVLSDWVVSKSV